MRAGGEAENEHPGAGVSEAGTGVPSRSGRDRPRGGLSDTGAVVAQPGQRSQATIASRRRSWADWMIGNWSGFLGKGVWERGANRNGQRVDRIHLG